MLYSSFMMDMYTDAPIIAWIVTDAVFTMPVIEQSIIKNGKLIVKGMNTFYKFCWVHIILRTLLLEYRRDMYLQLT